MRFAASVLLFTALTATAMSASTHDAWRPIFNGVDLDGWTHVGPGKFVVEGGVLRTEGGMGLLWYERERFGDTTIKVVYRTPGPRGNGNSGVFIRIPDAPSDPWMAVNTGYEVQIDDDDDDFHRTGVLYSFTRARAKPSPQEWNTLEIRLDGDRTLVSVNGTVVTDFREGDPVPPQQKPHEPNRGPRPRTGFIGLQNHGTEDVVLFREISVKAK